MKDETANCLEDLKSQGERLTVKELRQTYCARCKNPQCGHAEFANTVWDQRILTQQDRLLDNPNFADPNDPRYDFIRKIEWQNMVREAIRLNVSERRGDWSVPDVRPALFVPVPETPDESQTKTTDMVDEAVKSLAAARGKEGPSLPTPVEDESQELGVLEEPNVQEVTSTLVDPPVPIVRPQPSPNLPKAVPAIRNTRVPRGGVMVDGAERPLVDLQPTQHAKHPTQPQQDAWAVPKHKVIKPGATVSLSSGKKK